MNKMVNLRLGEKLLREIDSIVKRSTYESRTEFIRQALHKEVSEQKKKELIESFRKKRGIGTRMGIKMPTDEEFEKIREDVWNEMYEKH